MTAPALLSMAQVSLVAATAVLVPVLVLCRTVLPRRPALRSATLTTVAVVLLLIPPAAWLAQAAGLGLRSPPTSAREDAATPASRVGARLGDRSAPTMTAAPPSGYAASDVETTIPTGAWVVGVWALVAAGVLLPLAPAWVRARRLRRTSIVVTEPLWCAARQQVDRELGVRRPYVLAASHRTSAPVALGTWRPVVLLPHEWVSQPPSAGDRAVLAHEVGHVVRRDVLRAVIDRVVLAVYAVHPLVWWLHRAAAVAREEACDNHALRLTSPHRLAETLLGLSHSLSSAAPPVLLAPSIRGWSLEQRVRGLLSETRDTRSSVGWRAVAASSVAMACLAAGVVVGCTTSASETSGSAPPRDPAAPLADAPHLDPVLTELGFDRLRAASLEFVHDYGSFPVPLTFDDGRVIPDETTWTFVPATPLLEALSQARSVRYAPDQWPDAKATFVVTGVLDDGSRLQISFHAVAGGATVSRTNEAGVRTGGHWTFTGASERLAALMRTRAASRIEVPLSGAFVWRAEVEDGAGGLSGQVCRDSATLRARLADLRAPADVTPPAGFSFEHGVAVVVRGPRSDPPRGLRFGTPLLRDGRRLEHLVLIWPLGEEQRADAATSAPVGVAFYDLRGHVRRDDVREIVLVGPTGGEVVLETR